jgi:alkylated DNA repair dioxygenase AlkB
METAEAGVPGLRYQPRWLDGAQQRDLLAVIDTGDWSTGLRRRVQHHGHRYDYRRRTLGSGRGEAIGPIPGWARALARRLLEERQTGEEPDQIIVNEYQPGQGISAHVDCVTCFGPVVAAVSLGSACAMDFIDPDRVGRVALWLEPGSLCVMTGPARYDWRHGIAARRSDARPGGRAARGRRVSVTFRTVLP